MATHEIKANLDVDGEVQGTSLDINGNADISGNLTITGSILNNVENASLDIFGGNDTTNDAHIKLHGNANNFGSLELNYGYDSTNSYFKVKQGSTENFKLQGGNATFTGNVDVNGTEITVGTNGSIFAENNIRFKSSGAAFIDHNTTSQSIKFRLSNSSALDVTPFEITPGYMASTVDMYFGDSDKIRLGAGSDLQIYHDGSNSFVADAGTGGLFLEGNSEVRIRKQGTSEIMLQCVADGAVNLYHNNVKKFETTSAGATVTGSVTATTFSGDLNGTINTATTAATQSASNNSTKVATTAYVDTQVATIVDSAPGALNTLNELAAALGDDASFSTTVTNSIATKLPLAAGSGSPLTGDLHINHNGGSAPIKIDIHNTGTNAADDALIAFETQGAADWAIGIDRSDSNKFKISRSSTLGTNDVFSLLTNDATFAGTITTGGDLTIGGTGGIFIPEYIYHTGDTNSFFGFSSNDHFKINTSGATALTIDSSRNSTFTGDVLLGSSKGLYTNLVQAVSSAGLQLGNDNNSGYVFVKDSGEVCVGTKTPATNNNYGTGDLNVENDTFAAIQVMSHSSTAGNYSFLGLGKSSGTGASPTIVQANETVAGIRYYGYDGNDYRALATISAAVDGTPGDDDMPGKLEFWTTADGAINPTKRLTISASGVASFNGHVNLDDNNHLLWGGNAIVTHTGSATNIGDNGSASALILSGGNQATFAGEVEAASLDINGAANISGVVTIGTNTLTSSSGKIAFGGRVSGSTPTGTTDFTTKAYVDLQVSNLIDSAPANLNTLNELAEALNDDDDAIVTINTALAARLPLAGGTMSGAIAMGNQNISGVGNLSVNAGNLSITGDGSHAVTLTQSGNGDFTIDAADDIRLDAGGADVVYKDGGTEFGRLSNSSTDFVISVSTQDKDILFKGNDNGSAITALTLDMSDAGAAYFNQWIYTASGGIGRDAHNTIDFSTDNHITFKTNNSTAMQIDSNQSVKVVSGSLQISGDNANFATLTESGSGTLTVATADDFIVDAVGDIILDAADNDVLFKDAGTHIGTINMSSSNLSIISSVSNKDIIFKGNDGGSTITALTLDMSDNGVAIFNDKIYIPSYIAHDGDPDSLFGFSGNDTFILNTAGTTALTVDSSQNATFAGDLTVSGTDIRTGGNNGLDLGDDSSVLTIGKTNEIWAMNDTNADATMYLNHRGYNAASTRFRSFEVRDGKGAAIVNFNGSDKKSTFAGEVEAASLDINGNADITGNTQLGSGTLRVSTDSSFNTSYSYTLRDGVGVSNPNSSSFAVSSTTVMAVGAMSGGSVNTSLITTGAIGVGTASPSAMLDVNGEVQATSLDINGNADISGNLTGVDDLTMSGNIDCVDIDSSGTITGDGSGIDTINGSNISSGTVAAARVATLNQNTTGTAAIATTVTVADESSDTACNVLFATAATGNLGPKSGTNLTFNSSSGVLTATGFSGALTGNASGSSGSCTGNSVTATTATNANNVKTTSVSNSAEYFGVFVDANGTAYQDLHVGAGLKYNPSADTLTAGKITTDTAAIVENAKSNAALMTLTGAGAGNEANITLKLAGTVHGSPVKMKMIAENGDGTGVGNGILSFHPNEDTLGIGQTTTHNSMAMLINNSDVVSFKNQATFTNGIEVTSGTNSTSKTTGTVKVTGGVGIAKALNVGEDVVAYASSDERYKDNLTPITNPIDKIKSLTGYTFTWNDKHEQFNGNDDIGIVAQEVEKVFPEIVDTRDNGYKAVKYEKMVAVLIEAVKDQQKQIDELKELCNGCSK